MARPVLKLRLIEFACLDAYANMALDQHLLDLGEAAAGEGFLRFYTWTRPSLSLGHNEPADVVDQAKARQDGVDIVRRPTGGRVVIHGDDLTYAAVLPARAGKNLSDTYRLISEAIIEGLGSAGLKLELQRGTPGRLRAVQRPCFASVSRYEVTYEGRKVMGSAQRIGRNAILQHGSIPLGRGYLEVVDYMNCSASERQNLMRVLRATTACLNDIAGRKLDPKALSSQLTKAFTDHLNCPAAAFTVTHFRSPIVRLSKRLRTEFR
jgi:lipoate-protein ligase A